MSELKPDIAVVAPRARSGVGAGFLRIEVIAANAVEADPPALGVVERTIPPVIIGPQGRPAAKDQQAVKQNGENQMRQGYHRKTFARSGDGAKGK
jgi:hypothetical protein